MRGTERVVSALARKAAHRWRLLPSETHTVSQKFLPWLCKAPLMAFDLMSSDTTGLLATLVVMVLSLAMPMVAHLAPTPK